MLAQEPAIDIRLPLRTVRESWLRHVERRYLQELLAAHGGNVSAAARAAGIDRVHMHRLLVKAGPTVSPYQPSRTGISQ